jgi:hypothetical protein
MIQPAPASDGKYVVREARLTLPPPSLATRLLNRLTDFIVNVLAAAVVLSALFGSIWFLDTRTPFAGWIGLAITAVLVVVIGWGDWVWRIRKHDQRRLAALQTAAKTPLHGIRFDDGSVSDFVPDGYVELRGGSLMAFDMQNRLLRHLVRANDREGIGSGSVFGMAAWMRFSVENLSRLGLGNRVRQRLGLKPRRETVLVVQEGELRPARFPLAPGHEVEARRLAAKANRALADSAHEAAI